MTHHITAIEIRDFKRIHDVKIRPESDRTIILIGGRNAQGKSSILDALTVALGGKDELPSDPVRHGAADAEIKIEIDNGTFNVRRRIDPDGSSKLEVRDELGAIKSPQAMLDKLIAGRFLDPLEFLQLKATEQRARLLKLVDRDGAIAKLDERRDRVFARRTEVARDHRKAAGELERMHPVDPAEPIDVAELSATSRKMSEALLEVKNRQSKRDYAERAKVAAQKRTAEAAEALDRAIAMHKEAAAAESDAIDVFMAARAAVDEVTIVAGEVSGPANTPHLLELVRARQAEIEAEIKRAADHNRTIATLHAGEKRRLDVQAEVAKLVGDVDAFSTEIERIDNDKATFLAAAALPVPGLGITADAVTLNGVPLAQASDAEKLRVALALAIASNPELRDVWIKDGARLDDQSLELVAEVAGAAEIRVWLERVGTRDAGAIIIHDGRIVVDQAVVAGQGSLFP